MAHLLSELVQEEEEDATNHSSPVALEFLPAVAVFGSYQDEHETVVRYLSSVDYYGPQATNTKPSSLLPFFDEEEAVSSETTSSNKELPVFAGISALAIGAGLENDQDVSKIRSFVESMSRKELPCGIIQPNPEYATMTQELEAFRILSPDAKAEATRLHTLGPGKMAKFVLDFARGIVRDRLLQMSSPPTKSLDTTVEHAVMEQQDESDDPRNGESSTETTPISIPHCINADQTRYTCRKCRTVLFGQDDFEDPPHVPARHSFSARKVNHGSVLHRTSAPDRPFCQSHFLRDGLPWMGDMSAFEGKFGCPKCGTKLGTWHWSGSQCSCGTWVVPAIQIPLSRVDEIPPLSHSVGPPAGTVVSPFARIGTETNMGMGYKLSSGSVFLS